MNALEQIMSKVQTLISYDRIDLKCNCLFRSLNQKTSNYTYVEREAFFIFNNTIDKIGAQIFKSNS